MPEADELGNDVSSAARAATTPHPSGFESDTSACRLLAYSLRRSGRRLSKTVVVCCVLLVCACGKGKASADADTRSDSSQHEKALNLLIWSGVFAPNTVSNFEKQTGIKVHVSYAASNEDMETRIMTGNSGFDVVGPVADYLKREIEAGAYLSLDKSKLPHLTNMDPQLMREVAFQDQDNAHATILEWGTNGIGYNEKMIKHLMPDAPLDTWGLIFDPAIASRIAKCGIGVVDSGVDLMRAVLPYLGRDPNSQKSEDLAAAAAALMKVRSYISHISSIDYVQALANGDLCIVLGFSGDVSQARDRARESNSGIEIKYVIPKEGSVMWFMLLAIPNHAPNVDGAHRFIDYIMTPNVIADISNFSHLPNGNVAALPLLTPAMRNDPANYPPPDVRERLSVMLPDSPEQQRAVMRMWQRFKAGT